VRVRQGQRLFDDSPLVVRVRCSAACDLLASAERGRSHQLAGDDASLRRGGVATMKLTPLVSSAWRTGRIRVEVRSGAPAAHTASVRKLSVRVVRRRPPPLPAVLGLSARRGPRGITVRFRTSAAARRVYFFVEARPARHRHYASSRSDDFAGRGRTRFTSQVGPRSARWVVVSMQARDRPYRTRAYAVRVSG
jgi:hypothetical protein